MRTIPYLSPSGIKCFDTNEEDFYERYLADTKTPRDPQLLVMAVGSAFDAFIKSYLYKELKMGDDPQFERRTIFEDQVEEQHRDEAWKIGKKVFDFYVKYGAAADLLIMLGDCTDAKFEFKLEGAISSQFCDLTNQVGGPPTLLGKPDLYFTHKDGGRVILDWKVNGYFSKKKPSPCKGYLNILADALTYKRRQHKDVFEGFLHGIKINLTHTLELVNKDWGRQLAIYGWLLGEEVGSDFIVAIDQIICGNQNVYGIAQHRCTVSQRYQTELFNHACKIWERCHSGHFFTGLSLEDNKARCDFLDTGPMNPEDIPGMGRER